MNQDAGRASRRGIENRLRAIWHARRGSAASPFRRRRAPVAPGRFSRLIRGRPRLHPPTSAGCALHLYLPNATRTRPSSTTISLDERRARGRRVLSQDPTVVVATSSIPRTRTCGRAGDVADARCSRLARRWRRFSRRLDRDRHAHRAAGGTWDYQAGAWQRDHGFRIDHLLLSPECADRMIAAGVDKAYRGRERASDHTPVWVELA